MLSGIERHRNTKCKIELNVELHKPPTEAIPFRVFLLIWTS